VAYEIESQIATVEAGESVVQQTMGWDEARGVTVPQRGKEYADDYRYFPEPDLPLLEISREWVEELRAALPELPDAKRARFIADYGLLEYDAGLLVEDKPVADYYEAAVAAASRAEPKSVANWVTGELFRQMKERNVGIWDLGIPPAHMAEVADLVLLGITTADSAKTIIFDMTQTRQSPRQIIEAKGLTQISDTAELEEIIAQVLADNPQQVSDYRAGKEQLFGWLVGQVMRATKGKANPQVVRELLANQLQE
jgi:aspartyl-tRNA(Asn)/glutamyl-tRNA(Gln) amidotransferase subunit B